MTRKDYVEIAKAITLAVICAIAYQYGYDLSMTAEGFPIQGHIGALIPVALVLIGSAIGASIRDQA
jgi:TRAP-type mannitol/chloroaromatic compound transport system permease large subunit